MKQQYYYTHQIRQQGHKGGQAGRKGGQEGRQGGQEGLSALLFWPSWNTVFCVYRYNYISDVWVVCCMN